MTPEERAREIAEASGLWHCRHDIPMPCLMCIVERGIASAIRTAVEEAIASAPKLYRGVETPCPRCDGWGRRCYASTATWRGGVGGAMMTNDVCNVCWGTGDVNHRGANLRHMEAAIRGRKP